MNKIIMRMIILIWLIEMRNGLEWTANTLIDNVNDNSAWACNFQCAYQGMVGGANKALVTGFFSQQSFYLLVHQNVSASYTQILASSVSYGSLGSGAAVAALLERVEFEQTTITSIIILVAFAANPLELVEVNVAFVNSTGYLVERFAPTGRQFFLYEVDMPPTVLWQRALQSDRSFSDAGILSDGMLVASNYINCR